MTSYPRSDGPLPTYWDKGHFYLPLLDVPAFKTKQTTLVSNIYETSRYKLPLISEETKQSRKRRKRGPKPLGVQCRGIQIPWSDVVSASIDNTMATDDTRAMEFADVTLPVDCTCAGDTRPMDCILPSEECSPEPLLCLSDLWNYCRNINVLTSLGKLKTSTGTKRIIPGRLGPLRSNIGILNEKISSTSNRRDRPLPAIGTSGAGFPALQIPTQSSNKHSHLKYIRPVILEFENP